jgi:putative glycosyltransferase (TIGR04372 family)
MSVRGKYFSFHHRFIAWVGRLTNTIIVSPNPVAIGNASEDYYFGLLKARKEGKKLLVLFPYQFPGILRQPRFDPAFLFLESDLLLVKYRSPKFNCLSCMWTLYFLIVIVSRTLLSKVFRFKSSGYYFRPLAGQDILWRPDPSATKFDWVVAQSQDWHAQFSKPLLLSLPRSHTLSCVTECERMGLPSNSWYICLHVREGGYSGDLDNVRNANIANYYQAIKVVTQRGGYVVRMGDPTMTRLPNLDRVIDYAHAPNKCALLDVYLLQKCSFYVGTSSGLMDTAFLLEKPVVLTNMTHWLNGLPPSSGDLTIFKHVYSISERRFISVKEWLAQAKMITIEHWSSPDWRFFENTEEEIASVIKEKLDQPKNLVTTHLQNEFKSRHLHAVKELSKTLRFHASEVENCSDWFRFSSRVLTWRGEVSAEFLEKNWLECQHISPLFKRVANS